MYIYIYIYIYILNAVAHASYNSTTKQNLKFTQWGHLQTSFV